MTTALLPNPKARFFDSSGNPLSGGKVYTYAAGTTTPKASYTDSTGGTPNANPVVLDSAGEANIWLDGNYKIVLKDSSDVQQWSVDNVYSIDIHGFALNGANADITSMTGLTGALKAPTSINDTNNNEVVKFASVASAVNEVTLQNAATGTAPVIKATGGDATVDMALQMKAIGGHVYVYDHNGNIIWSFRPHPSGNSGAYIDYFPSYNSGATTSNNCEFDIKATAGSSITDQGFAFRHLGNPPIKVAFHASLTGTAGGGSCSFYQAASETLKVTFAAPNPIASSHTITLPPAAGIANDVWYTSGGGVTAFGRPITVAHAVGNWNAAGTLQRSDGITSVTKNSTGYWTVTLSTATGDAASSCFANGHSAGTAVIFTSKQVTTTTVDVWCHNTAGAATDPTLIALVVHGII